MRGSFMLQIQPHLPSTDHGYGNQKATYDVLDEEVDNLDAAAQDDHVHVAAGGCLPGRPVPGRAEGPGAAGRGAATAAADGGEGHP